MNKKLGGGSFSHTFFAQYLVSFTCCWISLFQTVNSCYYSHVVLLLVLEEHMLHWLWQMCHKTCWHNLPAEAAGWGEGSQWCKQGWKDQAWKGSCWCQYVHVLFPFLCPIHWYRSIWPFANYVVADAGLNESIVETEAYRSTRKQTFPYLDETFHLLNCGCCIKCQCHCTSVGMLGWAWQSLCHKEESQEPMFLP